MAFDRAAAALATKLTPLVGDQLAPALASELGKFRDALREQVSTQVHHDVADLVEQMIQTHLQPALQEQSGQITKVLAHELAALLPRLLREERAAAMLSSDPRDIKWFHSIDLGNGITSAGFKSPATLEAEFARLQLSKDALAGKRVLDVGCNDGFFALKCARLGADVTAIDGIFTNGLKYLQQHVEPKFQFYCMDLTSLSFSELGHFDIILYLGVLYHTMYPFEQLVKLSNACRPGATIFIESEYYNIPGHEDDPTIYFDYNQKLSIDASSPVFPSIAWVIQTLSRLEFSSIALLHPPSPSPARGRCTIRATYENGGATRRPFLFAAEQI